MSNVKLPPFMMDAGGYCYPATAGLTQDKGLTPWYGAIGQGCHAIPGSEPPGRWEGKTVVCVGSGPSLIEEDCTLVANAGLVTLAANDSWRRAPFAAAIVAVDHGWWQQHIHELVGVDAERWTDSVPAAEEFGLHLMVPRANAGNSGARAMELAALHGANKVILLGFDCSLADGTHWHGNHTRTGNPDDGTVGRWHTQFAALAQVLAQMGTEIVNCSRKSAITCFPRGDLETELDAEKVRKQEPAY